MWVRVIKTIEAEETKLEGMNKRKRLKTTISDTMAMFQKLGWWLTEYLHGTMTQWKI